MDYRHYRGEPLIGVPDWMNKYMHVLRHIGAGMAALSILIPFLIAVKVIPPNTVLAILSLVMIIVSGPMYFLGVSWNNHIDREQVSQGDYEEKDIVFLSNAGNTKKLDEQED